MEKNKRNEYKCKMWRFYKTSTHCQLQNATALGDFAPWPSRRELCPPPTLFYGP